MRYTDEVSERVDYFRDRGDDKDDEQGETMELCKWTVDLSTLPSFRQNASVAQPNGFYTGESRCAGRIWDLSHM